MPKVVDPLASIPKSLHVCPLHDDGPVSVEDRQAMHSGEPIFPTVRTRQIEIRYECGCDLSIAESLAKKISETA